MKKLYLLLLTLWTVSSTYSQQIEGRWTGYFKLEKDETNTSFEIEFKEKNGVISALTITRFNLRDQQYYNICSANVQLIREDSTVKIIVTEYKLNKTNTPEWFKPCFQEHTFWFSGSDERDVLNGQWKPANGSDKCGTGITLLKRVR